MTLSSEPHLRLYDHSLVLLTDLYQLTMAQGYWKAGLDKKEAVFHLFFRKYTFNGAFTIAAGLESVVDYLQNFRFQSSDLAYLATLRGVADELLFAPDFLNYLADMCFSCDIDAVPEGSVVFPYEPLVRVQGPLIQAQLIESALLNLINFPTLIATKAARICIAADGDPVFEFGLRRAQGVDGSITASRSAYIGGCEATSNVMAGKLFGIPVRGTHAHSWIMAFDSELEAFETYAQGQPDNCVFLVDTYDTIEGVKNAILVGNRLKQQGKKMQGIRLDSGDLAALSIQSRAMLDAAGFEEAKIVASNELDETIIADLKRQGAKIDVWGVGTNLVTAGNQPALDGVYKLSAIRDPGEAWRYKLKVSEKMTKVSNPGIMQVRRYVSKGKYMADLIYDLGFGLDVQSSMHGGMIDTSDSAILWKMNELWDFKELLVPIFRHGECVYTLPTLPAIRATTKNDLSYLPEAIKYLINPQRYCVGMDQPFYEFKVDLIQKIRNLDNRLND